MKKINLKILILVSCIAITLSFCTISCLNSVDTVEFYNGLPVSYSHASFAFDTSVPEIAVGASDYVFIAKINNILRTEYLNPVEIEINNEGDTIIMSDPYTIYSIDVVQNIKGELITSKSIELMQYGGLNENGESYSFLEGGSLLKEGEYYILLPDAIEDGGSIEVADPNRIVSLGSGIAKNQIKDNKLVRKYIKACEKQLKKLKKTNHISKYDLNYLQD